MSYEQTPRPRSTTLLGRRAGNAALAAPVHRPFSPDRVQITVIGGDLALGAPWTCPETALVTGDPDGDSWAAYQRELDPSSSSMRPIGSSDTAGLIGWLRSARAWYAEVPGREPVVHDPRRNPDHDPDDQSPALAALLRAL